MILKCIANAKPIMAATFGRGTGFQLRIASGGLIWIVVTAVLSELHGDRRNVALAEASAVAYAFGIVPVSLSCFKLAQCRACRCDVWRNNFTLVW
jgi:hypothetical protein